jgi:hypothetical protein
MLAKISSMPKLVLKDEDINFGIFPQEVLWNGNLEGQGKRKTMVVIEFLQTFLTHMAKA